MRQNNADYLELVWKIFLFLRQHLNPKMKDSFDNTYLAVKKIFIDYLQRRKLRKTPERFAILKEIYSTNGHFDIDSLYNRMKDNKYRVSRATLYNTIDLLLDCGLVIKHQFGHNCAQYERSYKFRQHDHFIDIETENVMEFCDPRLLEIQRSIEEQLGVEITHHSLIFYGHKKSWESRVESLEMWLGYSWKEKSW